MIHDQSGMLPPDARLVDPTYDNQMKFAEWIHHLAGGDGQWPEPSLSIEAKREWCETWLAKWTEAMLADARLCDAYRADPEHWARFMRQMVVCRGTTLYQDTALDSPVALP